MSDKDKITFKIREFKGSRFRCLMLTGLNKHDFADFMTALVQPHATVNPDHKWMPRGFVDPDEPKLDEASGLFSLEKGSELTNWWLKTGEGVNTPNWDIVCECTMSEGGKNGLILIEAKAHEDEFNCVTDNCGAKEPNKSHIESAMNEANESLNRTISGWRLSTDKCYQLSNRFAWAWKIAKSGTPVILVYLGFLKATEMMNSATLTSSDHWTNCVRARSKEFVPAEVWGQMLQIDNTPFLSLICSADVNITAGTVEKRSSNSSMQR